MKLKKVSEIDFLISERFNTLVREYLRLGNTPERDRWIIEQLRAIVRKDAEGSKPPGNDGPEEQ